MTDEEKRQIRDLFEYSLTQLRIDQTGIAASDRGDVMACAELCWRMRQALAGVANLDDLLTYRLVCATEELLTTYALVADDNPAIVNRWWNCRGELLSNRLGAI